MIIHIDMDAFFASVEIRENPELRNRPIVVGGAAASRSVVSAASYQARRFGIYSAMPMAMAKRACPQLVIVPVNMPLYVEVSQQIHEIFSRYTPQIEPLSLDEAFLDVTASMRLFGSPIEIARKIKESIFVELNLVASVGVAPNKFLAKMASDENKPDGFLVIHEDKIQEFLDPMPVTRLWGVGKVTATRLERFGITKVTQLRQQSETFMRDQFGNQGLHLMQLAKGHDNRRVKPEHKAKSISHETTFASDIYDDQVLKSVLLGLTEQVAYRLRAKNIEGRTVQLKLRNAEFHTITRSYTLDHDSNSTNEIWQVCVKLFTKVRQENKDSIRLIGMGVTGFKKNQARQHDLFVQSDPKQDILDKLSDTINERYGKKAVTRGSVRINSKKIKDQN
ncbi:DNA polymerase IV [hydrothermal vent metagenome]|uniref:DNA-directed DNA polymerase n=1 Tax=hydrothermal vent metagenome TaxID=652676 RepID=A0A3B1AA59_9ZZZZ